MAQNAAMQESFRSTLHASRDRKIEDTRGRDSPRSRSASARFARNATPFCWRTITSAPRCRKWPTRWPIR